MTSALGHGADDEYSLTYSLSIFITYCTRTLWTIQSTHARARVNRPVGLEELSNAPARSWGHVLETGQHAVIAALQTQRASQ